MDIITASFQQKRDKNLIFFINRRLILFCSIRRLMVPYRETLWWQWHLLVECHHCVTPWLDPSPPNEDTNCPQSRTLSWQWHPLVVEWLTECHHWVTPLSDTMTGSLTSQWGYQLSPIRTIWWQWHLLEVEWLTECHHWVTPCVTTEWHHDLIPHLPMRIPMVPNRQNHKATMTPSSGGAH